MSAITNPTQSSRTIYIAAIIALVFIATIGAILRYMFVRRMSRRRFNPHQVPTVVPSYPQNPNLYSNHQAPYVTPPAPMPSYPAQRPYSGTSYPDYSNPYSVPYNPPTNPPTNTLFPSPTSRPANITSHRVDPPKVPSSVQDGRASTRYGVESPESAMRRTDGRSDAHAPPTHNTRPSNDLGPPPAYQMDGRDG